MALKNCSRNIASVLLLSLLSASLAPGLRADIIDDINQLEPKKDQKTPTPKPVPKPTPTATPTPDMIPEPEELPRPITPEAKPGSKAPEKPKDKKSVKARRDAPIHLQSDGTSTYSRNGSVVHLQKNVVISQDDIRLQSDEARVLFSPDGKKENNNTVQTVEVNGKVNLTRLSKDPAERITAKSDKAIFDNNAQKVTLDGNARLWKDGHLIKGDRIVYEIVSGMIKVDRAQGVVQPEKAGK
ncbi:MAG TPA: LptA/OstA family protein [Oligoflexus sp.]|uniref:LptA/OstA family protein n=1 Tax=Oligoflexus sp. TaxID=1971216 RepID=UPI002D7E6FDA|nr:LptA/OstA family protein [Oligoflexus sp.]HET9238896.1 LptA/OstA family protein [Oligoflexus sp.]